MTTTTPQTYTILGEEFDFDELKGIARNGADTGAVSYTHLTLPTIYSV